MPSSLLLQLRAPAIAACLLLTASGSLSLMNSPQEPEEPSYRYQAAAGWPQSRDGKEAVAPAAAPQTPAAAPAAPAPAAAPLAPAAQPLAPRSKSIAVYKGLGAWVDQFDFGRPHTPDPSAVVDDLARRGVKTLYLQTGKWNTNLDLLDPASLNVYLERSHANRIKVVGWYLPGFGDIDTDVRRSMAVLNYVSPNGHRFDGFAPDIEDRVAVSKDLGRFNAGIAEYSRRLREAAGPDVALGAIVVDAKNNRRRPDNWTGFPWAQIGTYYDVVLPMAYWSVTKQHACGTQYDVGGYMRELVAEMEAGMGTKKPLHLIGGIADCNTPHELAAFSAVSIELGAVGGSVYDYWTTAASPHAEAFWAELTKLNTLAPSILVRQ